MKLTKEKTVELIQTIARFVENDDNFKGSVDFKCSYLESGEFEVDASCNMSKESEIITLD